jgi:hypothetical protein
MKCKCGNNEFVGRQNCYHDVVVDGDNNWVKDVKVTDSNTPYGPYYCTKCGKVYYELKN